DKADYKLQWFTPLIEVDLCGHATIASLHFLNEQNLLKESIIKFETRSGILNCGIKDGKYFMQIPVYQTDYYDGNTDQIVEALGIHPSDLFVDVPFVLCSNKYLYVYVKSLDALGKLKPDFKTLRNLSVEKKDFQAVTVFTLETFDDDSTAHSRFFAPFYGIDEDPVTGSSNGPLLLVLLKLGFIQLSDSEIQLNFEQGDFINRKGRVGVTYYKTDLMEELFISGQAVTVLKGEMTFTQSASVDLNEKLNLP